jgi:Fe-S cluster assembly protein SufD
VLELTNERALVRRDATLHWIAGGLGSRLTKTFLDARLVGQGATALLSGVFFADGAQHLDLDTEQNHLAPNAKSDLLYKGALKESARAVWQGMIRVAKDAQKTDGYQANRNLILSDQARADSIPGQPTCGIRRGRSSLDSDRSENGLHGDFHVFFSTTFEARSTEVIV